MCALCCALERDASYTMLARWHGRLALGIPPPLPLLLSSAAAHVRSDF